MKPYKICLIIFVSFVFATLLVSIFFSLSYFELRGAIKICNTNFGEGNWTFIETHDYYSCKSFNQINHITTSQDCFLNGERVIC